MSQKESGLCRGSSLPLGACRYGCSKVSVDVPHNKITGPVAELARVLYFTRREAEEMMHAPKLDPKVRHYATDTANYAHDLEFFARQLGLALKMPTGAGGQMGRLTGTRDPVIHNVLCPTRYSDSVSRSHDPLPRPTCHDHLLNYFHHRQGHRHHHASEG
ncbi:unnamed protein product [Symbiodinium sp. CCMP2592]|nr:unnamed protein product [Symbiodinium sp. CCMP2592]